MPATEINVERYINDSVQPCICVNISRVGFSIPKEPKPYNLWLVDSSSIKICLPKDVN